MPDTTNRALYNAGELIDYIYYLSRQSDKPYGLSLAQIQEAITEWKNGTFSS